MKTAFAKPAVFSYQETMSAGRRLEGVHQGQSHCEVYGGSERLHHTKYWRAEQAWKKFERHPTSRSVLEKCSRNRYEIPGALRVTQVTEETPLSAVIGVAATAPSLRRTAITLLGEVALKQNTRGILPL